MSRQQLVKSRREQILGIAQKHGAVSVKLFGSTARGDAVESSDVDFVVGTGAGPYSFGFRRLAIRPGEIIGLRGGRCDGERFTRAYPGDGTASFFPPLWPKVSS